MLYISEYKGFFVYYSYFLKNEKIGMGFAFYMGKKGGKQMLKELVKTKRNFVLIGESGSGKSEIALFLAKTLSDYTDKKIRLIDMDQTKGMYRSRDWKERVENDQIHVYCGEHFMDMPLVPHGMANKLDDENAVNILDVGGNEIGAVVLGQYSQWLNNENSVVFYIINPYRNFSGSKDNILFLMERIQKAGHIQKIHVISNPNLGPSTTEEDVCNGHEILKKMLVDTEYEIEALMIPVWLPKEVFINMDIPVYFIKPMIQFL